MFEGYTQAARRVIFRARYIAGRLGSNKIEGEHLLLALLSTDQTLARRFFGSPWVAEEILKRVEQTKPHHEVMQGSAELPLTDASKHALFFAAEESESSATRKIGAEHLLLGLLREESGLAADILLERGVRIIDVRHQLQGEPHDDSVIEKFVREGVAYPQEIVRLRARVQEIRTRVEEAIGHHDFAEAKAYSDEEHGESEKLFSAYRRDGLADWIYG